jgi:hypothetical protein
MIGDLVAFAVSSVALSDHLSRLYDAGTPTPSGGVDHVHVDLPGALISVPAGRWPVVVSAVF